MWTVGEVRSCPATYTFSLGSVLSVTRRGPCPAGSRTFWGEKSHRTMTKVSALGMLSFSWAQVSTHQASTQRGRVKPRRERKIHEEEEGGGRVLYG